MAHIRVFRHYIHTPYLVMGFIEAAAIFAASFTGHFTLFGEFPSFSQHFPFALTFSIVNVICIVAMGTYEARLREGFTGVFLRTAVAIFLLGIFTMAIVLFFVKDLSQGRGVLVLSSIEGFIFITLIRWLTSSILGDDFLKSRVVIFGSGNRAIKVASRMRRKSDQRAFILHGFLLQEGATDSISKYGARAIPYPNCTLLAYCLDNDIDEIVVAADDRRAGSSDHPIPFDELLECRLSGIGVCEVQNFIEREAGKIDVDLLQRSWLVYSDGFVTNWFRAATKRTFDIVAALTLVVILSPVIAFSALIVAIGGRFHGPILYWQERVGLNSTIILVPKFRTMKVDAEETGAVWADHNDPRTTKAGRILRRSHMDELPQLFSVLRGDMSMVGPRPERPVFVEYLNDQVPFYPQRSRIKPGVTGWAQLCFPYGASIEDSKEKLQYDLYYLKNHSVLLDMVILLQTIEVVLVGEGAR